jgi:uncharacterized protein
MRLAPMKDSRRMTKPIVSRKAGLLLLVALLLCLPGVALSLTVPPPEGYVNDHANILSEREKAGLESILKRFEAETTNQVVLLVIPSLEGDSLEDFSIRVAESWKVGQKGRDNGVIFLVAVEDRKARIEVGYGLEGALTDAQSGRILRDLVFPAFRQGDYSGGIRAGLVGIMQAIQGEFPSQAAGQMTPTRQARAKASGLLLPLLFFLLLFSRAGRFFLLGGLLGGMFGGRGGGMGRGGFGGFSGGGGGFGGGGASGSW